MLTVNEMLSKGYVITNVEGRVVLTRYFAEYDETFLVPATNARGRWNTGTSFDIWLDKVDSKFGKRVKSISRDRVAIAGRI